MNRNLYLKPSLELITFYAFSFNNKFFRFITVINIEPTQAKNLTKLLQMGSLTYDGEAWKQRSFHTWIYACPSKAYLFSGFRTLRLRTIWQAWRSIWGAFEWASIISAARSRAPASTAFVACNGERRVSVVTTANPCNATITEGNKNIITLL